MAEGDEPARHGEPPPVASEAAKVERLMAARLEWLRAGSPPRADPAAPPSPGAAASSAAIAAHADAARSAASKAFERVERAQTERRAVWEAQMAETAGEQAGSEAGGSSDDARRAAASAAASACFEVMLRDKPVHLARVAAQAASAAVRSSGARFGEAVAAGIAAAEGLEYTRTEGGAAAAAAAALEGARAGESAEGASRAARSAAAAAGSGGPVRVGRTTILDVGNEAYSRAQAASQELLREGRTGGGRTLRAVEKAEISQTSRELGSTGRETALVALRTGHLPYEALAAALAAVDAAVEASEADAPSRWPLATLQSAVRAACPAAAKAAARWPTQPEVVRVAAQAAVRVHRHAATGDDSACAPDASDVETVALSVARSAAIERGEGAAPSAKTIARTADETLSRWRQARARVQTAASKLDLCETRAAAAALRAAAEQGVRCELARTLSLDVRLAAASE